MPVTYCERWNKKLRCPIEELDEQQARARHQDGRLYTAVVGDPQAPDALVQVRFETDMVSVDFLAEKARPYLAYQFDVSEGRLFLSHATMRARGDGDGAAVPTYEHHRFDRDGHVWGLREEQGVRDTWEQWADVADNWEDIPTFGDYAGVLRLERDIKPLDGPPSQVDMPA